MPVCNNCGYKWKWQETVFSALLVKNRAECPNCGEMQYVSVKSRKQSNFVSLVPLFVLFINPFFDLSLLCFFTIVILLFSVVLSLLPFLCELSNEEEALW